MGVGGLDTRFSNGLSYYWKKLRKYRLQGYGEPVSRQPACSIQKFLLFRISLQSLLRVVVYVASAGRLIMTDIAIWCFFFFFVLICNVYKIVAALVCGSMLGRSVCMHLISATVKRSRFRGMY